MMTNDIQYDTQSLLKLVKGVDIFHPILRYPIPLGNLSELCDIATRHHVIVFAMIKNTGTLEDILSGNIDISITDIAYVNMHKLINKG